MHPTNWHNLPSKIWERVSEIIIIIIIIIKTKQPTFRTNLSKVPCTNMTITWKPLVSFIDIAWHEACLVPTHASTLCYINIYDWYNKLDEVITMESCSACGCGSGGGGGWITSCNMVILLHRKEAMKVHSKWKLCVCKSIYTLRTIKCYI